MLDKRFRANIVLVLAGVGTIISHLTGVNSNPLWRRKVDTPFIPLSAVLPGGKGVTYLSDLTQNFGDEMSRQISLGGKIVSDLGDDIQNYENLSSKNVDDISRIVDSSYDRSDDDDDQGISKSYRDDFEEDGY